MPGFTAVAAGIGLATTAATTTGSFIQAKNQRNAAIDAQEKADKAMEEARKKLDVNFYASLSIPKEAYAQQVQANLVAGAGAIQAATEGEARGAGVVAGMVQAQQNQAQNEIRANMGQDLYNLQAATAQEDARLRDIGIQLDLGEVEGAQLAATNATELSAQALQQGMQGVTSFASQAASLAPLYEKSASTRQYNKLVKENVGNEPGQFKTLADFQNDLITNKTSQTPIDLSGVTSTNDPAYFENEIKNIMAADKTLTREAAAAQVKKRMTGNQFMDYMIQQDRGQLRDLRNIYNP